MYVNKISKDQLDLLLKIQGKIDTSRFHLSIRTNLEDEAEWILFQQFPDNELYFSDYNKSIMNSDVDSIEELKQYLDKHNGFKRRF